jgi:uncharacterized membrane protein SpoIIM required for sporulation
MNTQRWIARREINWKRLEILLQRGEKKGLKSLQASEIRELASLYRSVSADLARAKTYQLGNIIIQDLQQLTNRGYNQIYQGDRRQEWVAVREFYLWGFPQMVQQTWGYLALSTAMFCFGGLIAWWYAWQDPVFLSLIVPEQLISMVRDEHKLWMGSILGIEPLASSSIMINNIAVCFNAIAGGITLGLLTIYILTFNGLLIGAIASLVGQNNLGYPFWAFVFPHGSLELPAIFLAGAAGLLIARGILFPGKYKRIDGIKFYSFKAAQLVFGIIPMLIIAGVIEGFFSPSTLFPEGIKYLVGMGIFALLIMYLSRQRITDN